MITFLYDILDINKYSSYAEKARIVVMKNKGRFSISSYGSFDIMSIEGEKPDVVNLAVFPSKEKYFEFYYGDEYKPLIEERNSFCRSQIIMLEKL